MQKLSDEIMAEGDSTADKIVAVSPEQRTWENCILPMAIFESKMSTLENNLSFYRQVSPHKDLRDKSMTIEEALDNWSIKLSMRYDLYKAFTEYRELAKGNGEWSKLTNEQ